MSSRLYRYRLPSSCPFCPIREGLLLEWNEGWGEIAPLPGFSKETLEEALSEILFWLPRLKEAKPKLPSVQWAIATASRPFSFAPLEKPLCALGEKKGFATRKLKIGHLAVSQAVALAKKWVGQCALRLDGNRTWNLQQVLEFASHFSPTDFEYWEEPVKTVEELKSFSKQTHFPVAVDESLREGKIEEIPTLRAAVVKPMLCGSIPLLPQGVELVLSSSYESSVGLVQIARLAKEPCAALGLDTFCEDLLIPPLVAKEGKLLWSHPQSIDTSKLCLIASAP